VSGQDHEAIRHSSIEAFRTVMRYAEENPASLVRTIPNWFDGGRAAVARELLPIMGDISPTLWSICKSYFRGRLGVTNLDKLRMIDPVLAKSLPRNATISVVEPAGAVNLTGVALRVAGLEILRPSDSGRTLDHGNVSISYSEGHYE
jgi:hypothetical protein